MRKWLTFLTWLEGDMTTITRHSRWPKEGDSPGGVHIAQSAQDTRLFGFAPPARFKSNKGSVGEGAKRKLNQRKLNTFKGYTIPPTIKQGQPVTVARYWETKADTLISLG
eukprot:1309504-Rhodomonas_salina.1